MQILHFYPLWGAYCNAVYCDSMPAVDCMLHVKDVTKQITDCMVLTNRHPKRDGSEGFSLIVYRLCLMFDDFQLLFFKIIDLYMGIEPGWARISPGYIWEQFPSRERP